MLTDGQKLHPSHVQFVIQDNLVLPKSLTSNSRFKQLVASWISSRVPTRLISSIYIVRMTKPDTDFLIKTHGHILSFFIALFQQIFTKAITHMRPDYFSPYNDLCNFME